MAGQVILRPYQIVGRDFLAARTKALLADEMRVGKTPQAILAAAEVRAKQVLTVCPAIAVPQWRTEWIKWWPEDQEPPRVLVTSYDKARDRVAELTAQRWDVFIPDECHYAGNPTALRTALVYGKSGVGWTSDHIWPLSGTPAPKSVASLWPMFKAFGIVGMTYEEYVRRYCRTDRGGKILGTREDMIPELRELLAKCMLRRKRKEVAPDMPDIDFNFLNVEPKFGPGALLSSPELRTLSGDELLDWMEKNAENERQFRIDVAKAKVSALAEQIIFAVENELYAQTVVFGFHVEPLEMLTRILNDRGIKAATLNGKTSDGERVRIQQGFHRGEIQVVDANVVTAGTAIDLSPARQGYFLEMDWVPGTNSQAANRLISMEKEDKVNIDVVTWPGSTDDHIQRCLLTRVRELATLY